MASRDVAWSLVRPKRCCIADSIVGSARRAGLGAANLTVGSFDELVHGIRQTLKKIKDRPGLIDVEVPVRISGTRPGAVFLPFHYSAQAANHLTAAMRDPVSKQPTFKTSAVRLPRLGPSGPVEGRRAPAPAVGASSPVETVSPGEAET